MKQLKFSYNFDTGFYEIYENNQVFYTAHYLNFFFKVAQRYCVRNSSSEDLIKITHKNRFLIFDTLKIEILNEALGYYEEVEICHRIKLIRNKFKLLYQGKYYLFDRKNLYDTENNLLAQFQYERSSCGRAETHYLTENIKLFAVAITVSFLIDFIGEKYE
jgi:hypothetical protein